jgi:hypothetical protein
MSEAPQHDLAFLHTAHVHIDRFDQLVRKSATCLRVRHEVRPDLLELAQTVGSGHPDLVRQVHAGMREAASSGARLVVCTCSTIGAIAEQFGMFATFQCQRIDRAMADAAVAAGPKILVVVTLASTLRGTNDLLQQSSNSLGKVVSLHSLEVNEAWPHFLAQNHAEYASTIAASIRRFSAGYDAIVLAQASMQAVVPLLHDLGAPVFSSPQIGVERALLHFR